MTDHQVIYTATKMKHVLDSIEDGLFGASPQKIERFNFLRKISNWLGETAAVYICLRIKGEGWMSEEMSARMTVEAIEDIKAWDRILDETITAIQAKENHPAELNFGFLLNARYLAEEMITYYQNS